MSLARIFGLGCTVLLLWDGLAEDVTEAPRVERNRGNLVTLSGEIAPSGLAEVRVHSGNETVRILSNVDFSKVGGSLDIQVGTQRVTALNFVWQTFSPTSVPDFSTRPELAARWSALWTARWARPEWPDAAVAALSAAPFSYVVLEPKDGAISPSISAFLESFHQHCASDWAGIEQRYAAQVEQSRLYKLEIEREEAERAARRARGEPPVRLLRIEQVPRSTVTESAEAPR